MSSSYHPQTDGQTERLNQCLENFLRCSVHSCPKQWSKWLSMVEFWYNTSYHTALGRTPFEIHYGYSPKTFGISTAAQLHSPDLGQWLLERNLLNDVLYHQLHRAQRTKQQANKHRSEREFKVGDQVYLKLQPFIQSSVAPRGNSKLCFRYYGTFKVLARVGAVAYRLDLPDDARIHPVIHVSQLKQHVPPFVQVESDISHLPVEPDNTVSPISFQNSRMVRKGSSSLFQVQVLWSGLPSTLMTWEEISDLRRQYPSSPAWGQASFQEGAIVRDPKMAADSRPTTEGSAGRKTDSVGG